MVWQSSASGQTVDLVDPTAEQVDFEDIAHALAYANRYNGNAFIPCSIGYHTLIGLDLVTNKLRPWWLIHDAYKVRLGEVARPSADALAALLPPAAAAALVAARTTLRQRHDRVIHARAGLPLPTDAQRAAIERADAQCLATEARDFHRTPARPWPIQPGIEPGRSIRRFTSPESVADQLITRFRRYLPSLQEDATRGGFPDRIGGGSTV